jgi:hypothetical protein
MTEPPRDPYERYRPRPAREQPRQGPYGQPANGQYDPYEPQPSNEQAGRPRFIPSGLRPGEPDYSQPDYRQPDYGQPGRFIPRGDYYPPPQQTEPRGGWSGQPPQTPPPPPPRRKRRWPKVFLGLAAAFVLLIVIVVATSSHSSNSGSPSAATSPSAASSSTAPAAHAAAAKPSPTKPAAQTVTYSVTGSTADVTYGPSGSDFQGSVPMTKTETLDNNASYYAITAQLQGSGEVSCSIEVNGKVIDHATAEGDYNIADCEITQGLFGKWESTNG